MSEQIEVTVTVNEINENAAQDVVSEVTSDPVDYGVAKSSDHTIPVRVSYAAYVVQCGNVGVKPLITEEDWGDEKTLHNASRSKGDYVLPPSFNVTAAEKKEGKPYMLSIQKWIKGGEGLLWSEKSAQQVDGLYTPSGRLRREPILKAVSASTGCAADQSERVWALFLVASERRMAQAMTGANPPDMRELGGFLPPAESPDVWAGVRKYFLP